MSTTTEKQDAWAQYFWQQPVDASLGEKLNRIAQIEEDWLGKLEEDKVENEVSNNDESDEDQSQGKGFMPESRTTINHVCIRRDEKAMTPSKRQLDTNGNLIPLPPATPPPAASSLQDLPSVLEKKVIALAAPAGVSSSDVTVSPVAFQGELIPIDNDSRPNESPRRPYRISKAWKAAEAANRSIGVENSPQNAPVTEDEVDSSGRYKTQDASGENRQSEEDLEYVERADLGLKNTAEAANESIGVESSPQDAPTTKGGVNGSDKYKTQDVSDENCQSEEDLECVEHADLGLKNTAEAANGSIAVESSPRDAPITEGEINSSDNYQAQDASGGDRQSKEDLECVEHADLGMKNGSEEPNGGAENEVPETGEIVRGDIANGNGGVEGADVDEGNMEAQDSSEDSIDEKEKLGDRVGDDVSRTDDVNKESEGTESDEGFDIEAGNMDARQPSEDSTSKEQEPADKVESDLPVSDGIGEELDETIGTGVLDVEDEETEPQHPVKVDIADEVSPMRSFFSRGLALYMEARGFVEPGDEALDGEGLENDQGQNAVEPLMRKGESFIEWGLALLLEAMDGSIGI